MKKYESYKIISEPWIGNIPSHWIKSRVGRHFKIERGRVISKEEIQDNIGDYPVYSSQTSNNGELGRISTYDFDGEYVTWTTDGEKTGTCFHRTGKFNTTNVCGMLSVRESTPYSLKYLNYYLNQVTRPYVRLDINPKLMNNMMSEIPLVIPSIQEQHQIVQFLDEKTELIDKLISTKERKISLLKEQRTSFINQVVTKGLNPNVKMKDSGVDWIGEIPEHWIKSKVKYVSIIFGRIGYRGYTVEDIVSEGEGVITISPSNIKNDIFTIEGENTFLSFEKYEESPEIQIFTNDIILVKTGSTIGKTSIIPCDVPKMTINPQLVVLKELKIDNKYFYYQTVCEYFKKSFLVEQTGSTTPTISQEKINGFPILIPSRQEQCQIVEYIDSKTKEIDDLIQLEQKKIDLLKEYRQSLISEVVTGKIKVTTDE